MSARIGLAIVLLIAASAGFRLVTGAGVACALPTARTAQPTTVEPAALARLEELGYVGGDVIPDDELAALTQVSDSDRALAAALRTAETARRSGRRAAVDHEAFARLAAVGYLGDDEPEGSPSLPWPVFVTLPR